MGDMGNLVFQNDATGYGNQLPARPANSWSLCFFGSSYNLYDNRAIFRVLAFLLFIVPGRSGT